jgi:DNA helicase-2/ATP-dependent DNA helicase PcrA
MVRFLESLGRVGGAVVHQTPEPEVQVNPRLTERTRHSWPVDADAEEVFRRRAAQALVLDADRVGWRQAAEHADDDLTLDERALVQDWDRDIARLLEEARSASAVVEVQLPSTLSATAVERLRDQPERFARDLARPMPRRPVRAARFGTRFHAWVEAYLGQPGLLEPDDLPGGADREIAGEDDLRQLTEAFRDGPFGTRVPVAVEAPFNLVLAGQLVRGRIDAVYRQNDGYLVVDWKTSQDATADPLQLAIYRLAWAELMSVPVESVHAAFYYVRTGDVVPHHDLPGRRELERVVVERTTR